MFTGRCTVRERRTLGLINIKALYKNTTIKDMLTSVILVLGFVWLNTFIHQNSFSDTYGDFSSLKTFIISVFYTGLYFGLFKGWCNSESFCDSTKLCVMGTAISGIFMMMAVLLELGTEWFSIYGQKELVFGWLEIPKKYFYDIWTIVWFPFKLEVVFKSMKKEHFEFHSILNGCIVVFGLTIEGMLLFRSMANIWSVDLLVLNVASLSFAVWKYAFADINVRKGNAIASIILYTILRVCLLPLQCDNWGSEFASFMYAGDWDEVRSVINEVVTNASFFGTAEYFKNSTSLHNCLLDWNKPILQLLYYGGWIAVIGLLMALVYLVWLLVKMLGIKNGRIHKMWIIYATAVSMLLIRAVCGVLYGFGIPYPVALPFMGNSGIMDAMAFTLVLFGAWGNIQIQKNRKLEDMFLSAEMILGKQDSYLVKDENDELYKDELLFEDDVMVIGEECEFSCVADWYSLIERTFCVFVIKDDNLQGKRFILELANNKWILPDDSENEIKKQISKRYVTYNAPDCMEEEVEFIDEESDEEDYEDI